MELERITGDASLKRYFDTEYIGAYSLDAAIEPILTVESLWYGEVTLAGGRKEPHVIIRFKEKTVKGVEEVKPMILNATNRKALKKAYGADTAEVLEGKQIQLYIDPKVRDPQDGGFTEGLRIRPFKPRPQATPKPINCADCGSPIGAFGKKSAEEMAKYTTEKYGKPLCADCAKKVASAAKAEMNEEGLNENN